VDLSGNNTYTYHKSFSTHGTYGKYPKFRGRLGPLGFFYKGPKKTLNKKPDLEPWTDLSIRALFTNNQSGLLSRKPKAEFSREFEGWDFSGVNKRFHWGLGPKQSLGLFHYQRPVFILDLRFERITKGLGEDFDFTIASMIRQCFKTLAFTKVSMDLATRYDFREIPQKTPCYRGWVYWSDYHLDLTTTNRNVTAYEKAQASEKERLRITRREAQLDRAFAKALSLQDTERALRDLGITLELSRDTAFGFTESYIEGIGYTHSLTIPRLSQITEIFNLKNKWWHVLVYKVTKRSQWCNVVCLVGRDKTGQLWAHRLPPIAKTWSLEACERWLFQLKVGEEIAVSA